MTQQESSAVAPWLGWVQLNQEEREAFWQAWEAHKDEILVWADKRIIDMCELPLINHPLDVQTYAPQKREQGQVEAA